MLLLFKLEKCDLNENEKVNKFGYFTLNTLNKKAEKIKFKK